MFGDYKSFGCRLAKLSIGLGRQRGRWGLLYILDIPAGTALEVRDWGPASRAAMN